MMRELTKHEMEQVNGGPLPAILPLPAIVVTAARLVAGTAVATAVGTFVSNVVDDLMDDSTNSCSNDGA